MSIDYHRRFPPLSLEQREKEGFLMLLKDCLKEYHFDCKARKLSAKTIEGYVRMMGYLLDFLQEEHGVAEVEEVRPSHIKQYLLLMEEK